MNTKLTQTESQDHVNIILLNVKNCFYILQKKFKQSGPNVSFLCFLFSMLHPKRLNVAKLHLHFMLIHVEHFPRQTLVLILFDKML